MHTSIVVLLALAAVASAQFADQVVQFAPQPQFAAVRAAPIPILKHQEVRDDHGQYSLSYQTGDGQSFSDHGALKQSPEGYVLVKQGSFAYTAPDGTPIRLTYIADENGFQPIGQHIPVAPVAAPAPAPGAPIF